MKAFWTLIALLTLATVVVFMVDPSPNNNPDRQGGDTRSVPNGNPDRQGAGSAPAPAPPFTPPTNPLARQVRTDHEHNTQGFTPGGDFMTLLFGDAAGSGTAEVTEDVRAKDEASKQAQITQLESGIEVDGRFTIRGKGSPDAPFELPWELLMSAREVYVPKDGREIIPGRVRMLHESWVAITGYVMLPTVRDQVDEFVIMQNQWDGCCLGIPPTPYDSVEVALQEPIDFGFGGRQYATITGRMQVDPYLFGNGFLLGLYSIEDAKIQVTEW